MYSKSPAAKVKKPALLVRLFRREKKSKTVPLCSQVFKAIPEDMLVKELLPGGGGSQIVPISAQHDQWGRTTDSPYASDPSVPSASVAFTRTNYLSVPTPSHYHGSDTSAEDDTSSWYSSEVDSEVDTSMSSHPSPTQYSHQISYSASQSFYQGGDTMTSPAALQSSPFPGTLTATNHATSVTQMTTHTQNNSVTHYTYSAQSLVHQYTDNSVHISGNNTIHIGRR